jgi:Transposase DDE domain
VVSRRREGGLLFTRRKRGLDPREVDLKVFKSELQLIAIEPLGTPAELVALELLHDQPQPFDLRLRRCENGALGRERAHHAVQRPVFSRARHERFRESDALRRVFEGVVAMCIAAGFVGGEAFSVDASLIKADVDKKKRVAGDQPIAWPMAGETSRAVREYLTALDAARSDEESGDKDGGGSSGGGSRSNPPKEVSLTDPQATWVARPGVDPFFAYDANYPIDNKAGIIIDAEGTRANRVVEIAVTQTMMERVGRRFGLRPRRLAGDTVYGAVRLLKWLVDRSITPHIPVWDKSARHDGTFSRADFVFDQGRNIYVCPGGAVLTSTGNIDQGHIVYYRASRNDCSICSLKPKCTTAVVRKITRDLNEDVRDRVRALANTEAFQQSRRERKKVEMRFAHMKRILRLDRLRLRGLSGARDEVLLTATAQNLRRLVKLLGRGPPPFAVACPA